MKIELGDEVKCTVTGFRGIAIGRSEFLQGCARVGVQPKVGSDGKHPESHWIDEPQLEVIKKQKVKRGNKNTGGPLSSIPTFRESPR